MRSFENVGPGYVYTVTKAQSFRNNMLLGHFSGLSYWIFAKLFHREHSVDVLELLSRKYSTLERLKFIFTILYIGKLMTNFHPKQTICK